MTDCKKVFVDTAPFIYLIERDENNPHYHERVQNFFDDGYQNGIRFVTSVITLEEYLVYPYRMNEKGLISVFDDLLKAFAFDIIPINEEIAKKAAEIRAANRAIRAMDALQLSTAYISGCDLFLTNDKQLKSCGELRCIIIDEL